MVTVTDAGLEHNTDKWLGNVSTDVDYVAVGSGTGNEATDASSLASREYSAGKTNANVSFVETGSTGEYEARIRVKGGTEVPAGTDITEMAVYVGDPAGSGTLVIIDDFAAKTVEAGHTEEFVLPVDPQR